MEMQLLSRNHTMLSRFTLKVPSQPVDSSVQLLQKIECGFSSLSPLCGVSNQMVSKCSV